MITRIHTYYFEKLPMVIKNKILIIDSGCWVWQGEINRNGYGRFYFKGKRPMVHRFIYEFSKGAIGEGLILDHTCRNRPCCNPTHTSPVTHQQNTHRGRARLFS